jgi:hypothetical protein
MTQRQLDRAVARATGESRRLVRRRGFTLQSPRAIRWESVPPPQYVDWDAVAAARRADRPAP